MHWLHQDSPSVAPEIPEDVKKETKKEFQQATVSIPEISYPSPDTIIAWDPDIPAESQKILFEAKSYNSKWFWRLNNKVLGKAMGPKYWQPTQNGNFQLELVDDQKVVLNQVKFEVRGLSGQNN